MRTQDRPPRGGQTGQADQAEEAAPAGRGDQAVRLDTSPAPNGQATPGTPSADSRGGGHPLDSPSPAARPAGGLAGRRPGHPPPPGQPRAASRPRPARPGYPPPPAVRAPATPS